MIDLKSMTRDQLEIFWRETIFTLNHEELIECYLQIFIEFRDGYSNDLPQEMLHVLEEQQIQRKEKNPIDYRKYKCRANYIVGLSATLSAVVEKGLLTDLIIINKIDEFKNHIFEYRIKGKFSSRTTKEEIDMMNDILNDVIDFLQKINDVDE